MLRWIPYAMVRIAAFFTAGILIAIYFPGAFRLQQTVILSVILVFSYFLVIIFVRGRKAGLASGLIGLLAISLLGYAHVLIQTSTGDQTLSHPVHEPTKAYLAIVRSSPESKAKSWKFEVEVVATKNTYWQPEQGRVLLYVSKDIGELSWKYGDQLLIKGSPQALQSPANPGEFDFKRYLSFKSIYHQQFVRAEQVRWIASANRKGFVYYSHQVRAWAQSKLNQYVAGEQQQAIAAALVLGVTDGIDTDLLSAYAASGAMHVLAVSGLHVGIIYGILLFLLRPLNRFAWSRWAVAVVSLVCLWVFAFVTGLSPSVLRAVVMFSFVAIARPFGKRTNIYNTLAASAFVLLLYNPYLIMSVGFQLSYLAVLGIVYLQRPIYNLWDVESRIGDWVWQITCVSIAAQAATFSLGLLYFHQFPVYFLISNLFVIPLSTAVLALGILVLAFSFISPLAIMLGKLLTGIIYLLNETVLITEKLPFSLISDIHITTLQCWLLMIFLLCLILIFEFRKVQWLYASVIFAILFSYVQWNHFFNSINRSQFIVYSVSGHYAFEFIMNGQSYFIADSALSQDNDRQRFHIRPNRQLNGVAHVSGGESLPAAKWTKNMLIVEWQAKTIAHISKKGDNTPHHFQVDYLIVSNNSFPLNKKWTGSKKIGKLIVDGSNSRTYITKMRKFATAENIPFYSLLDEGAFTLTN
ncbi:MAG: competence protein ComEC family protein [Flammeovirgaceae bacterium]|jgi:competence protein ComEC|nr:competence protein ComEC family protein [Flammeovirgaceae bacterium]